MPDTSSLKPANENPWYVLMTLYGEQRGEEVDWELHKLNREVCNAWASSGLEDDERDLIAHLLPADFPSDFWAKHGSEIQTAHAQQSPRTLIMNERRPEGQVMADKRIPEAADHYGISGAAPAFGLGLEINDSEVCDAGLC